MRSAIAQRAPRIAMEASMVIRRPGEDAWWRATTINISRSGVLLQTSGLLLEPDTKVEMAVSLPVYGNLAASRIWGIGRIVRALASPCNAPIMAATFEEYRILQNEGADGETTVPHVTDPL